MKVLATRNPISENIVISFKHLDDLAHLWEEYRVIVQMSGLNEIEFILNDDIPTE